MRNKILAAAAVLALTFVGNTDAFAADAVYLLDATGNTYACKGINLTAIGGTLTQQVNENMTGSGTNRSTINFKAANPGIPLTDGSNSYTMTGSLNWNDTIKDGVHSGKVTYRWVFTRADGTVLGTIDGKNELGPTGTPMGAETGTCFQ